MIDPIVVDVAPVLAAVEELLKVALAITLGVCSAALLAVGLSSLFDGDEE